MTPLEAFLEQAFPHEAGHILVGRIVGIPIFGLDHFVIRGPNSEILPGNFATRSRTPDPTAVHMMPPRLLEAYASMVGGGLAGNFVSRVTADEYGIEKDRADLMLVSTKSLEEAAEESRIIIDQNLEAFDKLKDSIKNSYANLMRDPKIAEGRYPLLTNDQLEQICPQNKTLLHPILYINALRFDD